MTCGPRPTRRSKKSVLARRRSHFVPSSSSLAPPRPVAGGAFFVIPRGFPNRRGGLPLASPAMNADHAVHVIDRVLPRGLDHDVQAVRCGVARFLAATASEVELSAALRTCRSVMRMRLDHWAAMPPLDRLGWLRIAQASLAGDPDFGETRAHWLDLAEVMRNAFVDAGPPLCLARRAFASRSARRTAGCGLGHGSRSCGASVTPASRCPRPSAAGSTIVRSSTCGTPSTATSRRAPCSPRSSQETCDDRRTA